MRNYIFNLASRSNHSLFICQHTKHMSTNSKSHIIKVKSLNILPTFLKEALIGIILSDGHLGKQYKNARLTITFAERYFLLANYIYALFCKYSTPRGFQTRKVQSGKYSPYFGRITVTTLTSPIFTHYHNLFYKLSENGKYIKVIPLNIEELLTPVVIAFFIMGDGNYNKIKKVIRLCTNSFTKSEVELLSRAILNKFGVETRLEYTRNNQYILVVRTSQVPKLQNIVKEHVHPSMLFRIGLPISNI